MTNSIFFDTIWFLNGQEDGLPNINIVLSIKVKLWPKSENSLSSKIA